MSVLASSSQVGVRLQDGLGGGSLGAVLGRVASVEDQVVEVAGTRNAVHLLVLVRCGGGARDEVGHEKRVDGRPVQVVGARQGLSGVAPLSTVARLFVSRQVAVGLARVWVAGVRRIPLSVVRSVGSGLFVV